MAPAAKRQPVVEIESTVRLGRIAAYVMSRKSLFMLATLPAAASAAVLVARQNCIAPAHVCGIAKSLPRTSAFPEWVSRPAEDRAAPSLRLQGFRDRFRRDSAAAGALTQVFTLFGRQPAFARVAALDAAAVLRVFAQPHSPRPSEDGHHANGVARGQERIRRRRVVALKFLVHPNAIGSSLPSWLLGMAYAHGSTGEQQPTKRAPRRGREEIAATWPESRVL